MTWRNALPAFLAYPSPLPGVTVLQEYRNGLQKYRNDLQEYRNGLQEYCISLQEYRNGLATDLGNGLLA